MTVVDTARPVRSGLVAHVDATLAASAAHLRVYRVEDDRWEQVAWPQVRERGHRIATWVRAHGAAGRTVGLIGEPTPDLVAAVLGAWLVGSPVSILPGPIRGAGPHRWARATATRFSELDTGVVLGSGADLDALAQAGGVDTRHLDDVLAHTPRADEIDSAAVPHEVVAVLQGTAGSTGDPKTAVLTAEAVAANTRALVARLDLDPTSDIGMTWLPLYHDMGLTFLLAGLHTGIDLWLAPNSAFAASPFRWPQWLTESRATVTAAPNFAYDIVGRYGRLLAGADLSAVRVAITGGEPIDPDAHDRFLQQAAAVGFDPAAAAPAYGMAESTCAVTMPARGDGAVHDTVTIRAQDGTTTTVRYAVLGPPVDGMAVRVVAPAAAAPDIVGRRVGAIEIRGTSMMTGYRGHTPLPVDEWFPTGDIGYLVNGRLVVCGRAKEVIIVAGRNLFPAEIERVAAGVPGIRRGGVVAVARAEGARRPGLVVIAEARDVDDPDAVRSAIVDAVVAECGVRPAEVALVAPGSVPRTTSGKLRRLAARDLLESGQLT